MTVCHRFVGARRDILCNKVPTADMSWSVRVLLDFSYTPAINEAFEGIRTDDEDDGLEIDGLELDWQTQSGGIDRSDVNNNP